MEPTGLLVMCSVAFVAVFVLLSFLALVMDGITRLFPAPVPTIEPEVIAAVSSVVATMFNGAKLTNIEALKGIEEE